MKFFRKIMLVVGLLAMLSITAKAAVFSTNLPSNGVYLLMTNRASVYSVEVTSSGSATLNFYDCASLAAPLYGTNYTNAQWVGRSTYATNYVYSFIGNNGFTNWYTNAGVWTVNVTNAANTNVLPVMFGAVVAGGTYAVYNADALFAQGVSVGCTGTNVSIVVNYRSAGP